MSQLSISPQLSDALEQRWSSAREGQRQCIHVEAPLGSGSSHVLSHFQRSVAQECLTWHVRFRDNLYGVEVLPTLANGLWKLLRHSTGMAQQIEQDLRIDLNDDRLTKIMTDMADGLQRIRESGGEELQLPQENPFLGLVMMARTLLQRYPMLIIFENLHLCHSFQPYVFMQAVLSDTEDSRLMVVLQTEPINEVSSLAIPEILVETLQSFNFSRLGLVPWDIEETKRFLLARGSELSPELVQAWSDGRQECVAELLQWIDEDPKGATALESRSLPLTESPMAGYTVELLRIAALLGWRFPIREVAMMAGVSVEMAVACLTEQSTLIELDLEDNGEEPMAAFRYVLHQLRLRADTIRNTPHAAKAVADNIRETMGRSRPEYLHSAANIYARIGDPVLSLECATTLWDLDSDALWLAMMEVVSRYQLLWSSHLMAPFWVRSARIYLLEVPTEADAFMRKALKWTMEADRYEAAIELLRLQAQTQTLNEQHYDAEKSLLGALEIALAKENVFLNVELRIDLLQLYTSVSQFRSANTQLTLLESLPLSTLQRIRLLGVHAEMNLRDGAYIQAASLLLEGRKISQSIRRWDLAIDAALSSIEALHVGDRSDDAGSLWRALEAEAARTNRSDRWLALGELLGLQGTSSSPSTENDPADHSEPAEVNDDHSAADSDSEDSSSSEADSSES